MMMDFEGAAAFLKQFNPLIHKTLQRLNMTQMQMDYEDYHQELQIKLIEILMVFKNDSGDLEEKNAKFVAYAGQGLYWHGLDLLQKKKHQAFERPDSESIEYLADYQTLDLESFEVDLYMEDFFRLAKKRLSEKDYSLLLQLASGQYTMQELATEYDVARDTIYQWKNKIQARLQDLKDCLID